MNYLTDIAPLENADQTNDAQIAALLSTLTAKPVPFGLFNNFLDDNNLAYRNPITLQWEGPLPVIAATDGHQLQAGISKLFRHLNKPQSEQIDTTQSPWCEMAAELLEGLIQFGTITEAHRAAFYALGGGLKHGVVSAEDVAAVRSRHVLKKYADKLSQRITGAINIAADADGATEASILAAAQEEAGL